MEPAQEGPVHLDQQPHSKSSPEHLRMQGPCQQPFAEEVTSPSRHHVTELTCLPPTPGLLELMAHLMCQHAAPGVTSADTITPY